MNFIHELYSFSRCFFSVAVEIFSFHFSLKFFQVHFPCDNSISSVYNSLSLSLCVHIFITTAHAQYTTMNAIAGTASFVVSFYWRDSSSKWFPYGYFAGTCLVIAIKSLLNAIKCYTHKFLIIDSTKSPHVHTCAGFCVWVCNVYIGMFVCLHR